MYNIKKLFYNFLFILIPLWGWAQNRLIGIPYINHIAFEKYKASPQIWGIAESTNNMLFFANNDGLLTYDGLYWKLFKGSKGFTRSVYSITNEKLISGSDDDFGEWKITAYGKWEYTSLYPYKDKVGHKQEEFWTCLATKEEYYFQSRENIYIINNRAVKKIKAPTEFSGLFESNGVVYATDIDQGLYMIQNQDLIALSTDSILQNIHAVGLVGTPNNLMIATKTKGLIKLNNGVATLVNNPVSEFIKKYNLFSFKPISSTQFSFGTIGNGCIIADANGQIIQHINKQKGLQNNTVLSIYYTKLGKLILGLDNGIDEVFIDSPVRLFYDYQGVFGTVYQALTNENNLYIGSNQGLYKIAKNDLGNPLNTMQFQLIPNSQGQVWSIKKIQDKILCGLSEGLFELKNDQLIQLDHVPTVWCFDLWDENHLITGNYNGLYVYIKENNQWKLYKKIPKFPDSSNQILISKKQQTLWVKSANSKIFKVQLNANFDITQLTGYPVNDSLLNNFYMRPAANNKVELISPLKKYQLDEKNKKIIPISAINLPNELVDLIVKDYFNSYTLSKPFDFYPIYNGFALVDTNYKKNQEKVNQPIISMSCAFGNESKIDIQNLSEISFNNNNIRVNFISPNQVLSYQYRLVGYDTKWSELTNLNSVEFLNLLEGDYTFEVKAFNGKQYSAVTSMSFVVSPPWYRTILAYIIWITLFLCLIYFIRKIQQKKLREQELNLIKEQQRHLDEQSKKHELEIVHEKQQNYELDKQRLEEILETKEMELAQKALIQKQNNELVEKIKNKIIQVQEKATPKMPQKAFLELIQYIDNKQNTDANKEFEIAFDNSQVKFHENLLKKHPTLTNKDLLLSSYLKMNMSSKQIASITGILSSSIDMNRSRLRKKLDLDKEANIRDYLRTFDQYPNEQN